MNLSPMLGVALLAVALPAQQSSLVVPQEFADVEGPGLLEVAGFAADVRQQVIISSDRLTALVGKTIEGLSFRRDRRRNTKFARGWVALTVSLSTSQVSPSKPSSIMADNVGRDAIQVFSGKIELPGSPVLSAEVSPWDPSCTARISFSIPFLYGGGDLCVELRPVFGLSTTDISLWPVDAVSSENHGSSVSVSNSCSTVPGSPGDFGPTNSFVDAHELVIGHSALFKARGTPLSTALFLLGAEQVPALDLAPLGSPGCFVHVQPGSKVYVTNFGAPVLPGNPELGGHADAAIEIPVSTGLLGAEFYCQWIEMGPKMIPSNTLHITLASDVATLGMSIVSAIYSSNAQPEIGHVSIDVAQVMRFDYR